MRPEISLDRSNIPHTRNLWIDEVIRQLRRAFLALKCNVLIRQGDAIFQDPSRGVPQVGPYISDPAYRNIDTFFFVVLKNVLWLAQ